MLPLLLPFVISFYGFPQGELIIEREGVTGQPRVIRAVPPQYPVLAQRARVNGTVKVEVKIDPLGRVSSVAETTGHNLLREAAIEAARQWRFDAAPSDAIRTVPLTFTFQFTKIDLGDAEGQLESVFVPPYHIDANWAFPRTIKLQHPQNGSSWPRCKLHGETLKLDTVEIVYGLQAYDKKYATAARKLFPEAHSSVGGGDVLEEPTRAEVLYCPKCRENEAKWLAQHRRR